MRKEDLKIVFLGTPDFAVASLKQLLEAGYPIVGVITAPDRKGGRGMKTIIQSAVKVYALSQGLTVLQPTNLKNPSFQEELKSLGADLQVVVAFRMLPEAVWNMPRLGTYNLHGSLLPKYRGAAPIHWAIMNGEDFTGVTTFKLKHKIDTGSIAFKKKVTIEKSDYLGDVHDKLMHEGALLIEKTVDAICDESIVLKEQDEGGVTKAPKIFHEDCVLDVDCSADVLYNKVRALNPFPVAWTTIMDKKVKVYRATYSDHHHGLATGTIITDGKSFLALAVLKGYLFLEEIKVEGKRKMKVQDWLMGLKITRNTTPGLLQIESPWSF